MFIFSQIGEEHEKFKVFTIHDLFLLFDLKC